MLPTQASSPLALRQYTKDVPPGWRPRAYPIKEYKNALDVWSRLSRLEPDQLGPAIMSRLEGGALKFAEGMTIARQQADGSVLTYRGIEAVSLLAQQAINDPQTGREIVPAYPSGAKTLITQLIKVLPVQIFHFTLARALLLRDVGQPLLGQGLIDDRLVTFVVG